MIYKASLEDIAKSKQAMLEATQKLMMQKRKEIEEEEKKRSEHKSSESEQEREDAQADPQPAGPSVQKSRETPLLSVLRERLFLGPMPVNEYMGLALAHPV